jgi:outer membrane receptor protein involved in Fe transport
MNIPHLSSWRNASHRRFASFSFFVALVAILLSAPAFAADNTKKTFDLPAGMARQTLKQFAAQAGREIVFAPDAVGTVATNAVKGELTTREALDQMLAGTGLVATHDAKTGAVAVRRSNSTSPTRKTGRAETAAVTRVAQASVAKPASTTGTTDEEPVVLSIFQVSEDADEGYRSTQTTSGSRTISNLRDTPSSISVLNREFLDDLMATKTGEALYFSVTGEQDTNSERSNEDFIFRGIVAAVRLRNGVVWWGGASDTYNIERGEVLRGPQAFLYGEGAPGGVLNQQTKQAVSRNFEKLNLMFGSNDLYRAEIDVNRRLSPKFAARIVMVAQHENAFQHYTGRDFYGAFGALNYRPFKHTNINLELEYRIQDGVMPMNTLTEAYTTTALNPNTFNTLTATNGGRTFIPGLGTIYDTVGRRRSAGLSSVIDDERIWPREFNFLGPDSKKSSKERNVAINVEQKIGENFNVALNLTYFDIEKYTTERTGGSATSVYRDINATLPSGAPNPYFNELYTEFYHRRINSRDFITSGRLTGVYDLKLPITQQKIVGSVLYNEDEPLGDFRSSEFVDPKSSFFKGTLSSDSTLAAYQANNTTLGQNFFYRRFYLKDGDGAQLTKGGAIAGQSVIMRDPVADGASGILIGRTYFTPAIGAGIDGSYFGGRLHSLVGWRRSMFKQDPYRELYNAVTGEKFRVLTGTPTHTKVIRSSYNYGAVFYPTKLVGLYYNYAESILLSNGVGAIAQLTPGAIRGPTIGDGHEFGLRWAFLGGRLESNWTYYVSKALKNNVNPSIPNNVRNELNPIFGAEIDPNGNDTQSNKSSGIEVETTANITKSWRLTWNIAKNEIDLSDRYPQLKGYQETAKGRNRPTPETDTFLSTVPDGVPVPGFTKWRSNVVTMYRFTEGPLKNFSIGGGLQYRDKSYRGNLDLDRNGIAEQLWSPGYTLYTLMAGYRTKIAKRNVDLNLNVYNLFDKDYFRSFSTFSGAWGDARTFRCTARVQF